jgi:hypothetical protein
LKENEKIDRIRKFPFSVHKHEVKNHESISINIRNGENISHSFAHSSYFFLFCH